MSDPRARLVQLSHHVRDCLVPLFWKADGYPVMVKITYLDSRRGQAQRYDRRHDQYLDLYWISPTYLAISAFDGGCDIPRLEKAWQEVASLKMEMTFEVSQLHLHAPDCVVTVFDFYGGGINKRHESLSAFFARERLPIFSWHATWGCTLKTGFLSLTRAQVGTAYWEMAGARVNTELARHLPAPLAAITVSLLVGCRL
jgi:hypothetical protein